MPPNPPTPDAILDAAEHLFARQGFAAASVKQLGAAAGVNPALLYYYFGDKVGLYEAVLERILGRVAAAAVERLEHAPSPAEAVREIVRVQVRVLVERPQAARLLLRELVDHEAEHAVPAAATFVATAFEGLCAAIRAGQARGDFRPDLRPEYAAYSTVAQVAYVVAARPLFTGRLGERSGLVGDDDVRAVGEHAAAFAVAALAAPTAGEASDPPAPAPRAAAARRTRSRP